MILNDSTVTTNSKTLSGLLNSRKYFWRVNAKNLAGTSAYSMIRNFTTIIAAPAPPILISPSTGALNQPIALTLNWGTVTGTATYRIQLATDSLFTSPIMNDSTLTSPTRPINGLLYNTRYYWRVNAKNAGGTSNWSAVWNFKTLSLPTVSGKVLYASSVPQNVKNVIVTLNPGGFISTTDNSGSFNFINVPNGSYTLSASTSNSWSNNEINATDALWISQAYVGTRIFSAIQNLAADVNLLGGVNNTDALLIVRRWAGLSNSFTSGDWVFTYPTVTVADSNLNLTVGALLTGDVNASSIMIGVLKQSFISFEEKDLLKIKQNEEFNIPITISQNVNLGAMNLSFNYPSDLASFEGVISSADNIITNENKGNVKIAWFDITGGQKPLSLKAGSNLIILRFKPFSAFKSGSAFSAQFDQGMCEFASADGNILPSVQLQLPTVSLSEPTEFSLMQNYPNPFNPSTTIKYSLANESNVTLKIYNSLGQNVREFKEGTRQQGNYEINFNAAGLSSGIYLFSISAQSTDGKNNFSAVKKMILMK
jgi:flagellar hook assembly protein FlgD